MSGRSLGHGARRRWARALSFKSPARLRAFRHALHQAQGAKRYLCARPFQRLRPATLDHVWPRARRRLSPAALRRNLLLAHGDCNVAKADRAPRPCEELYLAAILLKVEATFDLEGAAAP